MWLADDQQVEGLLTREARAELSFTRLLVLYLDPFALFKNAARGPVWVRWEARKYNRAMRWMLLRYVRRWLAIGAALFLMTVPVEALAASAPWAMIPAAVCALGACVAATVIACIGVTWFLLGMRE
jgi:hypothetical protein